jgi:glutathione S-transferase
MKLYYSPGACSLSPHIVLREAGLEFQPVKVSLRDKRTDDGSDFSQVNAKGYVPVLELGDGQRLTEGPAIVQYIADQAPAKNLAPAAGTLARYRLQEWLNFISTELHKQFSPLFDPASDEALKTRQRERIERRVAWIAPQLEKQPYLMGASFSVADAYLFTVLGWAGHVGIDLQRWPAVSAYLERVGSRPAVAAALAAEGLKKS